MIELKENCFIFQSSLFLKLSKDFIRLLSDARREVNLCVVRKELLWFDEILDEISLG